MRTRSHLQVMRWLSTLMTPTSIALLMKPLKQFSYTYTPWKDTESPHISIRYTVLEGCQKDFPDCALFMAEPSCLTKILTKSCLTTTARHGESKLEPRYEASHKNEYRFFNSLLLILPCIIIPIMFIVCCIIFSNAKYAKAPIIIGDPSYFPSSMTTRVGRVVRSICILNHPIAGTVWSRTFSRHLKCIGILRMHMSEYLYLFFEGCFYVSNCY